jgi:putative hemolysin
MLGLVTLIILILINGYFAMAEIAVVSAKRARLRLRAEAGDKGAEAALQLGEHPESFLATIQIGITLVAILMGAVGSTTIAEALVPYLEQVPALAGYSELIAGTTAVILVTFLTLVLGELAPKQTGLYRAERIAAGVAPFMTWLAKVTAPLVHFLTASARLIVRIMRIKPADGPAITEDEIQMVLSQAREEGVVEPIEEEIVGQLFRVGDLRVDDLMVDRREIRWLDVDDSPEVIKAKVSSNIHSRYPVARGNLDRVIGIVYVKDMVVQTLGKDVPELESLVKPVLFIPSGLPVFGVLERFKEAQTQIAFVTDEYGGVEGLVTFIDLLEAIVGDVPEMGDPQEPAAVQREDGSWLIDGKLAVEEFKQLFGLEELPEEEGNYYQTIGGFVMSYLGRIPQAGDYFTWNGLRIEVMDMDWRRVDKVLVERTADEELGAEKEE